MGLSLLRSTPALSPKRGRAFAWCWKILTLRLQSPPLCLSLPKHTTTKPGRIIKARANVSPSPRGEGWGEGGQDTRSLVRVLFGLGAGGPPEGQHGFEPFIISNLRLRWRSLLGSGAKPARRPRLRFRRRSSAGPARSLASRACRGPRDRR